MGIFDLFKRKEMQQLSRAEAKARAEERAREEKEKRARIAREEMLIRERRAVRGKKKGSSGTNGVRRMGCVHATWKVEKTTAILILVLLIPVVSAQDEEQQAGITPDSIFYKLDVFFDNLKAALIPSTVGRATARLEIMGERAAEMDEMAEKNKAAEAKKAKLELQHQIQKFEGSVEKIKKKDAPELKKQIEAHAEKLEMWKQRLSNYDIPDYADAMAEAIVLLETTENVIVTIPEDLDPDATFILSSMCKEAGATTTDECKEMISSGFLTAQIRAYGHGERPPDPHNCSGFWASRKTKWCCKDSDGSYSQEWIEMRESEGMKGILNYYYRKGTVEYKIINLQTEEIEQGIETDSCDGNTLTEWFCPRVMNMITRNERYSEEHDCPLGCEDGACRP
ncbi:MAG: DUF5667 domain-containing protein [Nanoarchaeota archaeon]|nr:DUF5667 domain-containing protein [Nanoarchaeota archaeon]